jgi:hypothetical protein
MTSWRDMMPSEFLSVTDLKPHETSWVTFEQIYPRTFKGGGADRQGERTKLMLKFREFQRPLISNIPLLKVITSVLGTEDPTQWIGKTIGLYVGKVEIFGEMKDGIKIDDRPRPAGSQPAPSTAAQPNDPIGIDKAIELAGALFRRNKDLAFAREHAIKMAPQHAAAMQGPPPSWPTGAVRFINVVLRDLPTINNNPMSEATKSTLLAEWAKASGANPATGEATGEDDIPF